jgi:hypothetical protein
MMTAPKWVAKFANRDQSRLSKGLSVTEANSRKLKVLANIDRSHFPIAPNDRFLITHIHQHPTRRADRFSEMNPAGDPINLK